MLSRCVLSSSTHRVYTTWSISRGERRIRSIRWVRRRKVRQIGQRGLENRQWERGRNECGCRARAPSLISQWKIWREGLLIAHSFLPPSSSSLVSHRERFIGRPVCVALSHLLTLSFVNSETLSFVNLGTDHLLALSNLEIEIYKKRGNRRLNSLNIDFIHCISGHYLYK